MFDVVIAVTNEEQREEMELILESEGLTHCAPTSVESFKSTEVCPNGGIILLEDSLCYKDDGYKISSVHKLWPNVGIITFSNKYDRTARVRALLSGADGCFPAKFDSLELMARITSLRRRLARSSPHRPHSDGWFLTQSGWEILSPCGSVHRLTNRERQFMLAIKNLSKQHLVVPRNEVINYLAEDSVQFDPHVLETLLSRLRSKIGRNFPLKTVRGKGYTFAAKLHG